MLFLKPFWICGTVSFWVLCGRRHFAPLPDIWSTGRFSLILLLLATTLVPLEVWVTERHLAWATMFRVTPGSPLVSYVLSVSALTHVLATVLGYKLSMVLLQTRGVGDLVRLSIGCFTAFFVTTALFYDTLMYAGTTEEYYGGVKKTVLDFLVSDRCFDGYIIFTIVFGFVFFCLALTWSSGYTSSEHKEFIFTLYREVFLQCGVVVGVYLMMMLLVGGEFFDMTRLLLIVSMMTSSHLCVVTPLWLSPASKDRTL